MRKDEEGNVCPETLGEYLDICIALRGEKTEAVAFLKKKIANSKEGRDEVVMVPDSQMRALLYPLMMRQLEDDHRDELQKQFLN